jgi:hypothetical protein
MNVNTFSNENMNCDEVCQNFKNWKLWTKNCLKPLKQGFENKTLFKFCEL